MQVLYLLFGWLLGILTAPIVDRIRRHRQLPELKHSLLLELDELRHKLVFVVADVRFSEGTQDREFVVWFKNHLEAYKGALTDLPSTNRLRQFAKLPVEDLLRVNLESAPLTTNVFVTYRLAFLESQMSNLGLLSSEIQRRLSDLVVRLDAFNQLVDKINTTHLLTFDSGLSGANREAVSENLRMYAHGVTRASMVIVRHIDTIEPSLTVNSK